MPASRLVIVFALALGCVASGCILGERCGPDEDFQDGLCVRVESDGGRADGTTHQDSDQTGLGQECTGGASCPVLAPVCVILPGQQTGYCTLEECSLEPDDCPHGYYCMDISAYKPEYTTICLKE
jgi:hypothetical protein